MDPAPSSPRVRDQKTQGRLEQILERGIWNSRLIVILAVLFGILSAFVLFIVGSIEIITTLRHSLSIADETIRHEEILVGIIGAVDFYLIGIVLLIFSFGVYELFISKIVVARNEGEFNNILEIYTLEDLKTRIAEVVIVVLIISFFQRMVTMVLKTSQDMLFMAISILAISLCVYFMYKHRV
ncbi:MAG: YqhA family protein [Methanofollis sp.]|nr:YqhA family protein [Methanofollis sp.]